MLDQLSRRRASPYHTKAWCRPVAALVLLLCSAFMMLSVRAADGADTAYRIPLMTWFGKYFEGAQAGHYKPVSNLDVPAIWLFSPDGLLVSRMTADNEAALTSLAGNFPPSASTPLADEPRLDALRSSFASASGTSAVHHPEIGKWTAVLFLSDSDACEHCVPFEKKVNELGRKSPSQVDVIRVTLTN